MSESMFEHIEEAEVSFSGFYLERGTYVVEVKRCFLKKGRSGDTFFIVEMKVIESNNADRPADCSPSWLVKMSQDAALGNIKGFLAAVNGIDPTDKDAVKAAITREVADLAVSDPDILAGVHVGVEVEPVKTKKGTDFNKHYWSPVEQP